MQTKSSNFFAILRKLQLCKKATLKRVKAHNINKC